MLFPLCALRIALLVEKGIYGKALEEKDPVGKKQNCNNRKQEKFNVIRLFFSLSIFT